MKPLILLAAILALLTIASPAATQELGVNSKDTGDPNLRVGSWKLVKIETSAKTFAASARESKVLPVDTRERKGIFWGYDFGTVQRIITAELVFKDLKETVTQSNAGVSGASPKVLIKAAVTGRKAVFSGEGRPGEGVVAEQNPKKDYTTFKCTFDFTSASGQAANTVIDYSYRQYRIYAGSSYPAGESRFWFHKKGEFECGGDNMRPLLKPEEDFTLTYRLMATEVFRGIDVDVDNTFHFFYRWQGWHYVSPGIPSTESSLISLVASRFNSLSGDPEKLSSAYADISMIADNWASKASPASGQKMKVGSDWAAHKAWAAEQGPKAALAHLQQKLSNTFGLLNRSQQDSFSAEVSAALANVGNAQTAASAPVSEGGPGVTSGSAGATGDGPTIQTRKPVFAPNETIEVEYANPAGHEWDLITIARPSDGDQSNVGSGVGSKKWESYTGKERSGTKTFEGLAEGQYEARYISWDGGNNRTTARSSFIVGKAPSPSTGGPTTGTGNPPVFGGSGDLSGLWVDDTRGGGLYRLRQMGNRVIWAVDAVSLKSFANWFQGEISGSQISGEWADLPGSPSLGGGRMVLRIESACKLVKTDSGSFYGARVWVKQGSRCDVSGELQRKPPAVEEIPETAATNSTGGGNVNRPGNRGKPEVEEIPETAVKQPQVAGNTDRTRNRGTVQPQVEEIPEVAVKPSRPERQGGRSGNTNTTSTGGGNQPGVEQPPTQRQPTGERWTLVSVTVTPGTPPQGWRYNAQSSSAQFTEYQGNQAAYQWSPPPQEIDSNGFTISLGVQARPVTNSRQAGVIGASGSGLTTDTPSDQQSAKVVAETAAGASARQSVTFRPVAGASEIEVRISMNWAITFTYKYRRAE